MRIFQHEIFCYFQHENILLLIFLLISLYNHKHERYYLYFHLSIFRDKVFVLGLTPQFITLCPRDMLQSKAVRNACFS